MQPQHWYISTAAMDRKPPIGPMPVGEMKVCINCWVHTALTANQPLYIDKITWIL